MPSLLEGIEGPEDFKSFTVRDLKSLAAEIRANLIRAVKTTGGHLGSNLAVVEATIAIHYVFDSPNDKIVFDTSHQSYTHKMLTGRAYAFTDPARYGSVSGFTNPAESVHDLFRCGHTSTSVSLACGLAKARDLAGQHHNVVALIGDGSLSGGEAYEGLDNAATLGSNLIVVFNDNEMSIAKDSGGIYAGLAELRASNGTSPRNLFRDLGLDYRYVADGNDLDALVAALREVKDIDHPVVVHIHTTKGKGDAWSEKNKEAAHSVAAADAQPLPPERDYRAVTRSYMGAKLAADPGVVIVNAGAPGGCGLTPAFRERAGRQYVDVGICEQHAVSFCAGLARGGAKPVFFVHSTFLQRGYDQLISDLALNDSPVTILVFEAGFSALDSTHVGVFDIGFAGNIPGLTCLAPATCEQYLAMLDWAIDQDVRPVVIRVPSRMVHDVDLGLATPQRFEAADVARYHVLKRGSRVALVGLGATSDLLGEVAFELKSRLGVDATIVCATTYSALDWRLFDELTIDHDLVVTFENGILFGGFGEKVARYFGPTRVRTICFGGTKEFVDRVPEGELMQRYHLEPTAVAADIARELERMGMIFAGDVGAPAGGAA